MSFMSPDERREYFPTLKEGDKVVYFERQGRYPIESRVYRITKSQLMISVAGGTELAFWRKNGKEVGGSNHTGPERHLERPTEGLLAEARKGRNFAVLRKMYESAMQDHDHERIEAMIEGYRSVPTTGGDEE